MSESIRAIICHVLGALCGMVVYFWWKWALGTSLAGMTVGGLMIMAFGGFLMATCAALCLAFNIGAIAIWSDVRRLRR